MKITALTHNEFLVETGELTGDLREIVGRCWLVGNTLRTAYKHGEIVLTPIRVTLGPRSFELVTHLAVGQSITL